MNQFNKPNFFIIGGPKCGTTSLAHWLSKQDDVFMSPIKEPHYFNFDGGHYRTTDKEKYEAFFKHTNSRHKAIGEASTGYLFSELAVPAILEYQPDAKFIVCVRNPVEMCYSLYFQHVFTGIEHIASFEDAWNAQESRRNEKWISKNGTDFLSFQYGPICRFGEQIQRLSNKVDCKNIHIVVLDDMRANPELTFQKVLEFLNVEVTIKSSLDSKNLSKRRKYMFLRKITLTLGMIKRRLGLVTNLGVMKKFENWNSSHTKRDPLSQTTVEMLKMYFSEDVKLLEKLIGRDLSDWYE